MNKQLSIDLANLLFAVFLILVVSIAFMAAIVSEEPRPAWNYLTNQWETLDCDTDTDCEQKYGEEPTHQLDDATFPPAQMYPLIEKRVNDETKIERRIT